MAANRRTGAWFFSLASLLLVIVVTAGIAPAQGTLAPAEAGSVSQRHPTLVIGSHHHVANGETVTTYSGSVPLLHESSAHCNPSGNANDLLVCVWLAEPRFGGFAVDESDGSVLKVWLTGEGPTGDAAQRVLDEVNRLWDRQLVSVDVQGASFDIGQLMTWFHRIIAKPGDLITGVDLDEGSNRLIVLVADASDETISSGTAHVRGLGVPEDSFAFEAHSTQIFPPTPDDLPRTARSRRSTSRTRVSISDQLLNHGLDPFVGGGSINSSTDCSAGFPVRVFNDSGDVEEGFVTAGHCGDLGVVFTAPDGDGNQQDLGTSVFNLSSQGVDAQYVRKSTTAKLGFGYIARTQSKNTAGGRIADEMRKLDPDNPYFRVSGHRRAAVGDEVHKVGNTTGWTSGTVTKTCYSVTLGDDTLSCLDAFTADSAGGDSGAPVFSLETDGTVTLRGTLTGSGASSGVRLTVMTPVDLAFSGLFYDRGFYVQVYPGDFDLDDDGLIEVANLEQLNALRWDLDGDGASSDSRYALAFPQGASDMGCPSDGCIGYELINDLDFDTNGSGEADAGDDYWNNRQGWVPIGSRRNRFDAVFDGNEHVIFSLYISVPKSDSIGLFGATGGSAKVRNVNLVGAVVVGDEEVGALIGLNGGRLTGSSATGVVTGGAGVGGLVGRNEGPLSGSSASVDVSAVADRVGGLVGRLHRSSVTASYATGSVSGQYRVGGLVGDSFRSTVSFSYSAGSSDGRGHVGGLIGWQSNQIITDSYWDTESSGLASSAGGNGKLTSELKSPTEYMGIYATWDVDLDDVDEDSFLTTGQDDPWDFGAAGAYPVLRPAAVPDAPSGLTAEFADSLASLTWQEVKSNRSAIIRMEYQKNGSVWFKVPQSASGGTNAVSYLVMGLDNGTEYSFAVRAVSWMGPGQGSNSVNVTPRTIPGPVHVDNVDSSQSSLTVSWFEPDDDGGSMVLNYDVRYIRADEDVTIDANWTLVEDTWASGSLEYEISGMSEPGNYLAQVRAVNDIGNGVWSHIARDRDTDDDGLIEISNLGQLHAMRWDVDGDGSSGNPDYYSTLAGRGCPANLGCSGYELVADLDFDTDGSGSVDAGDDYWNDGLGWEPVDGFLAVFDGGGRSISNLFIRRADEDHVGLFGYTKTSAGVKNVALASANVAGNTFVGGLVGTNSGTITTSFVSGNVRAYSAVGGLVGAQVGTVSSSYSSANVEATTGAGGSARAGGLAGYVTGTVNNSYSRGSVIGSEPVGGLSGLLGIYGIINASYWDTGTSQQSDSGGGVGKTTTELQQPTGYTGIFSTWDDDGSDVWHFGTCNNYPALKVDRDGDDVSTWQEFGGQRSSASPFTLKPTTSDAIVGQRVVMNTECENLLQYNWQRLQGGQWNDVGPDSFNKGVQVDSVGTRTYRLEATLDSGEVMTSDPLPITWRLPEITLIPSDPTPVIGHATTVSANVESGGAGASSYQWERKFGDEWREVGPEVATKRLIFHFAETATYRAAVTLTTGQAARSEPITLTWRNTSVDVTSSDYNPHAPELITLTANVTTAGEASPSSYRWQYQAPGISWANVGNDRDNLVITHGGGGVREYRVKVTMSDDEVVTSEPLSIEWREP